MKTDTRRQKRRQKEEEEERKEGEEEDENRREKKRTEGRRQITRHIMSVSSVNSTVTRTPSNRTPSGRVGPGDSEGGADKPAGQHHRHRDTTTAGRWSTWVNQQRLFNRDGCDVSLHPQWCSPAATIPIRCHRPSAGRLSAHYSVCWVLDLWRPADRGLRINTLSIKTELPRPLTSWLDLRTNKAPPD